MNQAARSSLSGLGWGTIGMGIGAFHGFEPWMTSLVLAGVPISLLVYSFSRWVYRKQRVNAGFVLWSIVSLYLATAIWGAAEASLYHLFHGPLRGWNTTPFGEACATGFTCCWGLSMAWWLWPLFGLSAATHYWLMRNEGKPSAS